MHDRGEKARNEDAKLDEQVGRTDKRWERKKGVGEPAAEAGVGEARKGGSSSPEGLRTGRSSRVWTSLWREGRVDDDG